MKKSDVLDRWTILLMKSRLDPAAATELEGFFLEIPRIILETKDWAATDTTRFLVAVVGLMEANARIWENEAALRKEIPSDPAAQGDPLTDKEEARRSRMIRQYNGQRVRARQEIDALFGEIPDHKVEHASG
jgi:hypothetical protein